MEIEKENMELNHRQYSGDGESRVRIHQAAAKIAAICEELRLSPAELDRAATEAKDRCVLTVRPEEAG